MAGIDTTRRRRVQGRSAGTSEVLSTNLTGRSNTTAGHHQQPLHHHHDHHHHHYHYHHHYHHFPRPLNEDQEQSLLLSSGGLYTPRESLSQIDLSYAEHQQGLSNRRPALSNSSQRAVFSREAANEDRDQLEERLRAVSMQSHRPSLRGNLLEEFSLLFEDDDDSWSDDELLERGIQEWLEAVGFEESVHSDAHSLSEQGLGKSFIRRLQRVVFVPNVARADTGVACGSLEQEDCSVCLEHFVSGQQLICLPCKHRFHSDCLIPWLESHAKCPYCRAKVSLEGLGAASSSQSGNASEVSFIEDDLSAWMETLDSELSQLNVR